MIKYLLIGVLSGISAAAARAQTPKDSVIAHARQVFRETNHDRTLRNVSLDEGEFTDETTDNGGRLVGYFKGDTLCKMTLEIGLSYAMTRLDYYFEHGQVIFIYETEKDYPVESVSRGLDNTRLVLAFEGRYYYENGSLITYVFKGQKRFIDNNATAYIGALPSKSDIRRYILLLMRRWRPGT
ncbi:MAG TPA: hypothetical protein VGR89_12325 [Puia sp.]|nr:hypothetical protein [Puia sp.]